MSGGKESSNPLVEITGDIESSINIINNKYMNRVGLRDLGFHFDLEKMKAFGIGMPLQGIAQAEFALRNNANFPQHDNRKHK